MPLCRAACVNIDKTSEKNQSRKETQKNNKRARKSRYKMQNTGTLSAHHKNVTRGCKNYAKNLPSNINFQDIQHQESLIVDESDASTNRLKQPQLQLSLLGHNKFIKYRRKTCASSWLLLVLICVIVKSEFVNGAVNSNSILNSSPNVNSNRNNKDNSTNYTRTLLAEIDDDIALFVDNEIEDFINLTSSSSSTFSTRPRVIYQNEFAVHILGGIEVANEIARKYGFTNMGQVSFYLNICCTLFSVPHSIVELLWFKCLDILFMHLCSITKNILLNFLRKYNEIHL